MDWLSDIETESASFLAETLLLQTNTWLMVVLALVAIILLMLRIQKPRPSYIVKVIAITMIIWTSVNTGWYLRDNDWGVDEVNEERQEQIDYLREKTFGK